MATYMVAANMVYDALSASYTHDTDVKIELDDVTDFPVAPGGVVYIDDGVEWVLVRYSVVDAPNDELETLSDPIAVFESAGASGHVFPIGTEVKLCRAADYINQVVNDIIGAPAGAIFYEDTDEIGSSADFTYDGTTFHCDDAAIFNESGADVDFRIEGVGVVNAFFVHGSDGHVGIGTATPTPMFEVVSINEIARFGGGVGPYITIGNGLAPTTGCYIQWNDTNNHMIVSPHARTDLVITNVGNVGMATVTFDAAAKVCFAVTSGTAPAAHTDNQAYLWVEDVNAAAGFAGFHMMGENGAGSIKQIVVGAVIKETTGQTANPHEGLIEINTFDNSLKMYAEAAWRDIAAGW